MGRTSKPIAEPTTRRWRDPVTGVDTVIPLDDVQKALDRVHQVLDGHMMWLTVADQERLVKRVRELLAGMVPHTD